MRVSIGSPRSCSGHIAHGAEESAGGSVAGERGGFFFVGGLGFEVLRDQIEDLDPVVGGEEDVVGLEVAVDDVAAVGGGETMGDPGSRQRRRPAARAVPEDPAEALTLEELGHDVRLVMVDADVVDGERLR